MKQYTVKIDTTKAIVLKPSPIGAGVVFSLEMFGRTMASSYMTPDQCGALIFGIETMEKQSQGVKCQGGDCAAGQKPCPSPEFCGVTA